MPNTLKEFKNYLQFLTPLDQITEINHVIHDILTYKNKDDNISKKYNIIKQLNIIQKKFLNTYNENNKH